MSAPAAQMCGEPPRYWKLWKVATGTGQIAAAPFEHGPYLETLSTFKSVAMITHLATGILSLLSSDKRDKIKSDGAREGFGNCVLRTIALRSCF